jgi:autotransporter-associated beta strand protein
LLAVGICLAHSGWAAPTTYRRTTTGNYVGWTNSTYWTPAGYPGTDPGDTALFTNTGYNIIIEVSPSFAWFNVGSAGSWKWRKVTWAGGSDQTVTLSGGLVYNSSGTSVFDEPYGGNSCLRLAGAGGITVNAGRFELNNWRRDHSFTGDITINAGILDAGNANSSCGPRNLGFSSQVYLGSTDATPADATLLVGGYWSDDNQAIYAPAIQVRAGNTGEAVIGYTDWMKGAASFTNWVTLEKDLTLWSESLASDWKYWPQRIHLSRVTGTGTITKKGVGHGSGSLWNHTGDVAVNGGTLWLYSSNATFQGTVHVNNGLLLYSGGDCFGNAANTITLGARGSVGGIGTWDANTLTNSRPIALVGNGGYIFSRAQASPVFTGVLSGPGRLIGINQNPFYLEGDNTYSGGTYAVDGAIDIRNSANYNKTVFGAGDVTIDIGGIVAVRGVNNVASGAKVLVKGVLRLYADHVPTLDTNSSGTISLGANSTSAMDARLATNAVQLGNGKMRLAGINTTYQGASLQAGIDGIYRLAGEAWSWYLYMDRAASTTGVLIGTNSLHALGGTVVVRDANTYQGETRVWSGALEGRAQAAGSPFGDTNGPVLVSGATWRLEGASGGVPVKKGVLKYERIGIVQLDRTTSNYSTELEVDSLVRSNKAVLAVWGTRGDLGGNERFKVATGAPVPVNGMVEPYYIGYDGYFLTYGANGFARAAATKATLSGALSTDIVHLAGTESVPSPMTVHALRTGVAVTGANKLTLGSGGLILLGGTHTAPFEFTGEGLIFCTTADSVLTNSALTAPVGFIKSGDKALVLGGDNRATLGGTITVNQGDLIVSTSNQLGSATVYLNGGALRFTTAVTLPNRIELGPGGGTFGGTAAGAGTGLYAGYITGAGALSMNGSWGTTIGGTSNDYRGGTFLYSGQQALTVNAGATLGTGPVGMGSGNGGTAGNNNNAISLYGDAIADNARVTLSNFGCELVIKPDVNLSIGSLIGNGQVDLDARATLTVGGDNTDHEYHGKIVDVNTADGGKLVKVGTGTMTLWNENTFGRGSTTPGYVIVSNGTLQVNNWLNTNMTVTVRPGATLDGIGTVGVVNNLGGTLKGRLVTSGLSQDASSVLAVALNGAAAGQYDAVTVQGSVTINGPLVLTLGFKPTAGQSFTIVANDGTDPVVVGALASRIVYAEYAGQTYRFTVTYNGDGGNDVVLFLPPTGTVFSVR